MLLFMNGRKILINISLLTGVHDDIEASIEEGVKDSK